MTYQGKIWAMPFLEDTFMLLYNKTLFKQAGLDPNKPPATWEEMRADADKLTKVDRSGKIIQTRHAADLRPAADFVGTWLPVYMTAFGGKLVDASGTRAHRRTARSAWRRCSGSATSTISGALPGSTASTRSSYTDLLRPRQRLLQRQDGHGGRGRILRQAGCRSTRRKLD